VLNRTALLLLPEGNRGELSALLQRVQIDGHGRTSEPHFVTRTKSGKTIDVSLVASPLHDDGGSVVGTALVARDLTQLTHDQRLRRTMELR
jgi:PAS domain S-box-containing protein